MTQSQSKLSLLRPLLKALGLSDTAVDDIVEWIKELLSLKDDRSSAKAEYPYSVSDRLLSPAEHSFFLVLRSVVGDSALIAMKVGLGDLFYTRAGDASKFRMYTNKIDRKHVDFLLCEPGTVTPLVGIELDDRSHQRSDRQARDEFVDNVFQAAGLPLIRIPAKHAYSTAELQTLLAPYLSTTPPVSAPEQVSGPETQPCCPKCGSDMVLRTARSGANQGEKFWGCSRYPQCRGTVSYEAASR